MVPQIVNGEFPQPAMLADSAKMQELEQRYIRLLEERCAKLEALLGEKSSETKAFRSIKIPSYCYYFPQVHLRAVHGRQER